MRLADNTILADRYRISRLLDHGATGAVYLAADMRFRDAPVLVRQTLLTAQRQGLRAAFQREAMQINTLRHPALPRVMDSFEYGDSACVVSEYIAGEDLATMLARQGTPFPVDRVALWVDRLLDALTYVHSRTPPVTHGHVEPRNVLLTPEGEIVLVELGIADATMAGTGAGAAMRSYASPESVNGREADGRSDLYSLAATAHFLLTMESPADANRRAMCRINGDADPIRPAHVLNPAVPPAVSEILAGALSLRADDRPESASAMRHALRVGFGELMHQLEPMKPQGVGRPDRVTSGWDMTTPGAWSTPESFTLPQSSTVVEGPLPRHPRTVVQRKDPGIAGPKNQDSPGGWTRATRVVVGVWLVFIAAIVVIGVSYMTSTKSIAVSPAVSHAPKYLMMELGKGLMVEMVLIEAGTFEMGAQDVGSESPAHQVTISKPYYIGKFEVTSEQWEALMGKPSNVPRSPTDTKPIANRPVENVSWIEVQEFIAKLNVKTGGGWRLPTEAEWEYACRAERGMDSIIDFHMREWYVENSNHRSQPVGGKRPNAWELHDMQGNVSEWCQDYFGDYSSLSQTDPGGPPTGSDRIIRGGNYDGEPCRFTGRRSSLPNLPAQGTGFRLAWSE